MQVPRLGEGVGKRSAALRASKGRRGFCMFELVPGMTAICRDGSGLGSPVEVNLPTCRDSRKSS